MKTNFSLQPRLFGLIGFRYQLLNQADLAPPAEVSAANTEVIERMIATFQFTGA